MGSASAALNGTGNQQVWVYTALSSQDINGNYSQYYGEVRYYGNGWGSYTANSQYWSASFNGQAASGSWTIPYANRNDAYTVLWTGYYNIGHNADGTMAGFNVSASIDSDHTSIGDGTASFTEGAAPTIPRASTPSFVGGSSLTTGTAVTINTNWASSSFTHVASYAFGTLTGQTTGFSASTGIGASFTWTPPVTMLAQIPNAASGNGTLYLDTYSGATYIGEKAIAFTLTAAGSVIPTISSVTIAEQNTTVSTQVGAYVQSLSNLKGTVNSAGIQGSTIANSQWSMSGSTVASGSNITPMTSGSVAIGAAATDSRGRTASYSTNITVMPYASPKINSAQVRRATALGVLDDNGTSLQIDLNAVVQSLVVGTEKNSLTIKVFTRVYGTTPWTARNSFTHTSVSYNTNVLITGGAIFPANQSFDVKIEVTDKFNTANPALSQMVVSTSAIFMHWSATGVGIGKYHTQGTLDVKGTIYGDDVAVTGGYVPITVTDWNSALKAGFYGCNNTAVNAPFAYWWKGVVVQQGNELIQILHSTSHPGIQFTRTYSGAWTPWETTSEGRGSTTVRNNLYALPSTDAARVALANRKLTWYNTDFGWVESYYATTGLAGLAVQGVMTGAASAWYPISGELPNVNLSASAPQTLNTGSIFVNWNAPGVGYSTRVGGASAITFSSGVALPKIAGSYRCAVNLPVQAGSGSGSLALAHYSSTGVLIHVDDDYTATLVASLPTHFRLETTHNLLLDETLRVYAYSIGGAIFAPNSAPAGEFFYGHYTLQYLGPPLVSN